jgi:hypothetical protein
MDGGDESQSKKQADKRSGEQHVGMSYKTEYKAI